MNEWHATYSPEGLTIIGVQGRGDLSEAVVREIGIDYPVADDPDLETWGDYGMRSQPSWAFIGPDGTLVQRQVGLVTTDTVRELIEQYTRD